LRERKFYKIEKCRDCGIEVSESAVSCPKCGAVYPYKEKWDGFDFEYKSKTTIFGLPLIHISFKYKGLLLFQQRE